MKPLEPKPPDPCPLPSSFLSWSPPCPDSSLHRLRFGICCTFVIPQWPDRRLKAQPLKLSLAFLAVLIANLGSGGMVLDDSILVFNVEALPKCQGSYSCSEQSVPEGHLLPVSLLFRLLGFRSESQVCFILLFSFPFRAPCCHSLHLGLNIPIAVLVIFLTIAQVLCVIIMLKIPSMWLCTINLLWRSSYICSCRFFLSLLIPFAMF